jgi:hypothetical protein
MLECFFPLQCWFLLGELAATVGVPDSAALSDRPRGKQASRGILLSQGGAEGDEDQDQNIAGLPDPHQDANPGQAWAEYNRKNRVAAGDFARSYPFGHLVLMRVCAQPWLHRVMARLLKLSSQKYELSNAVKASRGEPFEYRLLTLARDPLFSDFFSDINDRLHKRHHWEALPPLYRTRASGTLAFKLLSRVGGSVGMLLCRMYNSFPFRLFRLLDRDPAISAAVCAQPPCLWDDFTKEYRAMFPTDEDVQSEESLLLLETLLQLAANDTVKIEARHATLRRSLLRSIQTWRRSIQDLSTDWLLSQQRVSCRGPWQQLCSDNRRKKLLSSRKPQKKRRPPTKPVSEKPRAVRNRALKAAAGRQGKKSSSKWIAM